MCRQQMDSSNISHFEELGVSSLLYSPHQLLTGFFSASNCDLAVFVHDMERRLTYLSDSARAVCDLNVENWHRKNIELTFTDHPWNQVYRELSDGDLRPGEIQALKCEIQGDSGRTIQLEVHRQIIVSNGVLLGVVGIMRPLTDLGQLLCRTASLLCNSIDGKTILARWKTLNENEREVVEHVVAGEMNKTIAKKLQVAERTVEARRSKVMKKLGLRNVPDLVRFHLLVRQWEEANQSNWAT